jgi:hypothetical protein
MTNIAADFDSDLEILRPHLGHKIDLIEDDDPYAASGSRIWLVCKTDDERLACLAEEDRGF